MAIILFFAIIWPNDDLTIIIVINDNHGTNLIEKWNKRKRKCSNVSDRARIWRQVRLSNETAIKA